MSRHFPVPPPIGKRGRRKGRPEPVPDPLPPPTPGTDGAFEAGSTRAIEAARLGGKAKAEKEAKLKVLRTFGEKLGFRHNSEILRNEDMKPHLESALAFLEHEITRLAKEVGGGYCPPNAVAILLFAARSIAYSNYYADQMNLMSSEQSAQRATNFLKEAHAMVANSAIARDKANKGSGILGDDSQKSKVTLFVEGKGVVGHKEPGYIDEDDDETDVEEDEDE